MVPTSSPVDSHLGDVRLRGKLKFHESPGRKVKRDSVREKQRDEMGSIVICGGGGPAN
jgi:hypothetical protein